MKETVRVNVFSFEQKDYLIIDIVFIIQKFGPK